jgi:hypothetical protein
MIGRNPIFYEIPTIQELREELVLQPQQDYLCPGTRQYRAEQVQELIL